MLSVNPAQRPTIEEIKRDPWFNMCVPTGENRSKAETD
jgi:hypothetical protein